MHRQPWHLLRGLALIATFAALWGAAQPALAQAQEITLKLSRSVYLKKAEEEPFYLLQVDFQNLNRQALYENRNLKRRIQQLENARPINYQALHDALYDFVTHFGILNFRQDHDLDYVWKLGQVKEILRDTTGALFFYSIALKNNSRHFSQVRLQYDSLQALKRVEYVDLDYYYRIVSARLKIDTLAPPQSVLLNLGRDVNSPYPDYAPYMHPSNSVLVFTSRRSDFPPISQIDFAQVEDLYYTERDFVDGHWMPATRFPNSINSPFNEGSACLNDSGTVLFFTRCNSPDGMGSCDLYSAEWQGGDWVNVHNLGPNVNSEFWDSQPSLTPDGKALFFCSNRPGGFGRTDLYVCYRQRNGQWGPAQNLGPVINTIEDEITPFFHPIYNTLYFSSTGHIQNYGGFDIFKSRIRNGYWEEPHNLGPLVNSRGDESYFSIDGRGERLFYAMGRPNDPRNTDLYSFPMPMAARPDAVFRLNGYLMDSVTGNPLTGIVVAIDLDENVEIEPIYINRTGFFEFRMINNRNYQLLVIGENSIRVDRTESDNRDSVYVRIAQSIEHNKPLVFDNLQFGANSSHLQETMLSQLELLAEFIRTHPYCRLIISGHTDGDGDAAYNLTLSRERAEAIRSYILRQTEVDSSVVMAEGYGETRPIYPNDNAEHKARNRRVEFELIIPPQFRREYLASLEQLQRTLLQEQPQMIAMASGLVEFEDEMDALDFTMEERGDEAADEISLNLDSTEDEQMDEEREEFYDAFADEVGVNPRTRAFWDEDLQSVTLATGTGTPDEPGLVPTDEQGNPLEDAPADPTAGAETEVDWYAEPAPQATDPQPEPAQQPEPVADTDTDAEPEPVADADPRTPEPQQPEPTDDFDADFDLQFGSWGSNTIDVFVAEATDDEYYFFEYNINDDINQAVAVPELGSYIDNTPVLESRPASALQQTPEDLLRNTGRYFDTNEDSPDAPAPDSDDDTPAAPDDAN
jgi:outer membrane protein OmpA-like peptidoglycan-associated protein